MDYIISGIQQVGLGCKDIYETWAWYRKFFGADTPVFDEKAVAKLMLPYTGGQPRERHAVLALNMQGGGGFEIWQHTQHTPQYPAFKITLGDTGIFATKIKCHSAQKTFDSFVRRGVNVLSAAVEFSPESAEKYFWMKDPYDNLYQIVEVKGGWFQKNDHLTGGVYGVMIGTTDLEKTKALFQNVLGYDQIVYEPKADIFPDLKAVEGGQYPCARVLLRHSLTRAGGFAPLLGASEIELVQTFDRKPNKIFANRFWGECGFIQLCYDVNGMDGLKARLATEGYAFTVDSAESFQMEGAAGRFAYIETVDGTLIEFVETHKIPILKAVGWYLDLRKRRPDKSLPRWMLRALGLNRVRD
jgi:catechol 2,3-dioxygenase-like lactoylglutathione lyase family enzyme